MFSYTKFWQTTNIKSKKIKKKPLSKNEMLQLLTESGDEFSFKKLQLQGGKNFVAHWHNPHGNNLQTLWEDTLAADLARNIWSQKFRDEKKLGIDKRNLANTIISGVRLKF